MKKYLYEELAKRWLLTENSSVWLFSDPHFSDEQMNKLRFPNLTNEEADAFLIKQINSKVGKYGTLLLLGDVGNLNCVKKIKGYKVLIMGNHDEGNASKYKRVINEIQTFNELSEEDRAKILMNAEQIMKDPEAVEKLEAERHFRPKVEDNHLFDEVYEGPIMINDRIILSHEPIENLPSFMFNIHGHVHAGAGTYSAVRGEHYMNVCAEHISYTPVPYFDLIKKGRIAHIPTIHRETIDDATARKNKRRVSFNK